MCVGGGGGGGSSYAAKIIEPSKKDYDKVEDQVADLEKHVGSLLNKDATLNKLYELLHASNEGLNQTTQAALDLQTAAANNEILLMHDAWRLAMLKGPPPPEEGARAPVIGSDRDAWRDPSERGRALLRIDRDPTLAF